jgi:hypothetical protein
VGSSIAAGQHKCVTSQLRQAGGLDDAHALGAQQLDGGLDAATLVKSGHARATFTE